MECSLLIYLYFHLIGTIRYECISFLLFLLVDCCFQFAWHEQYFLVLFFHSVSSHFVKVSVDKHVLFRNAHNNFTNWSQWPKKKLIFRRFVNTFHLLSITLGMNTSFPFSFCFSICTNISFMNFFFILGD